MQTNAYSSLTYQQLVADIIKKVTTDLLQLLLFLPLLLCRGVFSNLDLSHCNITTIIAMSGIFGTAIKDKKLLVKFMRDVGFQGRKS